MHARMILLEDKEQPYEEGREPMIVGGVSLLYAQALLIDCICQNVLVFIRL